MRIAVIGTGNVGSMLGRRWAQQGHQVAFGSRHPQSDDTKTLTLQAGPNTQATTPPEAVEDADVVVLATPWDATKEAVQSLGDLAGKVVVDCTNPLGPDLTLAVGGSTSGAEQIAGWAPGARVVKAFNTTGAKNMGAPIYSGQRLAMFICGDDEDAKKTVTRLADELGFEPIDNGPLKQARYLEAMAAVWIAQAYRQGWGPDFGFAVLRR